MATTGTTTPKPPEICQGTGSGLFLPLFGEDENGWNNTLRIFLYLAGLLYCFLGVAIVSDIFMGAIEKVTSKKKRVLSKKTNRFVTVKIWNDTVANLTLMALGSSAPEILLNVIFILADGFFQEGLGPSTIVGSAAFNLFIISAVCVVAIPDGQVKRIKELPVYGITAFFSVFAYVWLLVILMVTSPNVVEVWEGVTTFLFFPVLVVLAYLADRGYLTNMGHKRTEEDDIIIVSGDMTKEELASLEAKIRHDHGSNISDQQVMKFIETEHKPARSRAEYRVAAVRELTGGKKVDVHSQADPMFNVVPTVTTSDDKADLLGKSQSAAIVEFAASNYSVVESDKVVKLHVVRRGNIDLHCMVNFRTKDGSAKAPQDFVHTEGRLRWAPGEVMKVIEVTIIDNNDFEEEETFDVEILASEDSPDSLIGPNATSTVTIIDDDMPGVLCFEKSAIDRPEASVDETIQIVVKRKVGGRGRITCKYETEDDTAIAGADYEYAAGELVWECGQMTACIPLTIKARGRYESTEHFRLIIKDIEGGAKFDKTTDGGAESCVMYVRIHANVATKERVDKILSNIKVNWDKAAIGHSNWRSQFKDALFVNGGEDSEEPVKPLDFIMHFLNLPWKLLCAIIPPTDFCDGWACFVCTLMVIGLVTAVIGDMAGLLGCCLFGPGNDGITAITFVALGTSLPDTFASKTAAQQDPYADASIGNVTGSNSVNVFLGLGLPWMVAAIYWPIAGPNQKWTDKYSQQEWIINPGFQGGALVVQDPGLANSVLVFSVCAVVCMGTFLLRRKFCGGELGGPTFSKYLTAAFFIVLWFIFVISYILMK